MRDEQLLPGNIGRIGVFRALQLGDLLCSTPALRALRAAFPNAQITLIGLPWAQDLVDRLDYVDRLLPFPGFPGLPEREPDLQSVPEFFRAAQACRFDLGMFAALIADARLLVSNDTGASHVAAATRTPSVVVCAGSDPDHRAPLDSERHQVVYHPVICRPCAHVECPFGHPCALAVTAQTVVQHARALLRKELLHAA